MSRISDMLELVEKLTSEKVVILCPECKIPVEVVGSGKYTCSKGHTFTYSV